MNIFVSHKRLKNVIVLPFTSYCFNFRSLTTSQENSKTFPKVRKTSSSFSGLVYIVINTFFIHLIATSSNLRLHLNTLRLHLNKYLLHLSTLRLHLNKYLLHLSTLRLHLSKYLLHLSKYLLHLNKSLLHLNKYLLHLSNSSAINNDQKAFISYSNFAICPLNHIHDHPATTPGSTVCLKRGVQPALSYCIVI